MAALEFITLSAPSKGFLLSFPTRFCCWPIATSDCCALQAWMPSCHVCWSSVLILAPQSPNQDPPRAQQLRSPDLLMVPHVRQAELMVVNLAASVCMRGTMINTKRKPLQKLQPWVSKHVCTPVKFVLTFAGLHALKPTVVKFTISTSTSLVPRTSRSTTTDSPKFRERAAGWACCHCRGTTCLGEWRGDWCGCDSPSS